MSYKHLKDTEALDWLSDFICDQLEAKDFHFYMLNHGEKLNRDELIEIILGLTYQIGIIRGEVNED